MWKESMMSAGQSVTVSLMGLAVVFLVLLALAAAVLIISAIIQAGIKAAGRADVQKTEAAPQTEGEEEEGRILAMILAAISEDSGMRPEEFRVTGVRKK